MRKTASALLEKASESAALDVVVIDDEESIREGCRQVLEDAGYRAAAVLDGERGVELVRERHPGVAIIDLKMPGLDGLEVLDRIARLDPAVAVMMITGYGSIDEAVRVMKGGAFDFLTKPFTPERLLSAVKRGMEIVHARKEAAAPAAVRPPAPASPAAPSAGRQRLDGLLKGLEVLGDVYSAGLERQGFWNDLLSVEAEAFPAGGNLLEPAERERRVRAILGDLRTVDRIIETFDFRKSHLIQILLEVNSQLGWLPPHARRWISERLEVPLARILSVASFYGTLSLKPRGRHQVHVCTGTACHVRGAGTQLQLASSLLDLKPGETSADLSYTLEAVHCLGCCAMAPVVTIDGRYYSNLDSRGMARALDGKEKVEGPACEKRS